MEQLALGSPFVYNFAKTGERYDLDINFTPFEKELLELCINTTGTNNRDKGVTWGVSQLLNSAGTLTEQYSIARGSQCDSITIDGSNERVAARSRWVSLDYTTPSAVSGLTGTPTWEPLTGTPWTGLSGGTDPVTWNAAAQKVRSYSVTVENAIDRVQFMGDAQLSYASPTTHRVSLELALIYKDTTIIADVKSLSNRTAKISLGPSSFLTFTNANLDAFDWTLSASSTEAMTVRYRGNAVKCEVTSS